MSEETRIEALGGEAWGQIEYPEHKERKKKRVRAACIADKVISAVLHAEAGMEAETEVMKPIIEGVVSKDEFKDAIFEALIDFAGGRQEVVHPTFADWVEEAVHKAMLAKKEMPDTYEFGTEYDLKPRLWRIKGGRGSGFATAMLVSPYQVEIDALLAMDEVLYTGKTIRLLLPLKEKWDYEVRQEMYKHFPPKKRKKKFPKGRADKFSGMAGYNRTGEAKQTEGFILHDEEKKDDSDE